MIQVPKITFSQYGKQRCAELQAQTRIGNVESLIAQHFFWWISACSVPGCQNARKSFESAQAQDKFEVPGLNGRKFTVTREWFEDFDSTMREFDAKARGTRAFFLNSKQSDSTVN